MMYLKKKGKTVLLLIAALVCSTASIDTFANEPKASINVDATKVKNKIIPWLYGACIEDVNHEIYGGIYDQKIFGESFEEPTAIQDFSAFSKFEGVWTVEDNLVGCSASRGGKVVYEKAELADGSFETDIRFDNERGNFAGIAFRVSEPGIGRDNFKGYAFSLSSVGKKINLTKHSNNVTDLVNAEVIYDPYVWNKLRVDLKGNTIEIFINDKSVIKYVDNNNPFLSGKICLRNLVSDVYYRNISYTIGGKKQTVTFDSPNPVLISRQWSPVITGNAKPAFAHDDKGAFNGKFSQMIELVNGEGKVGVSNMSLNRWGIAVRKGQKFEGRIYLKTTGLSGKATVALESEDGKTVYASQQIDNVTDSWAKYPFTLTTKGDDAKARFVVYIDKPGKLWIDMVVLMTTGKDQFKGLPLRNDVAQAMVDQGLKFLRYGGTMVNVPAYRFKDMIGDRDKRPPYRGHWYWWSTNGFGIEDFLQFCEKAGFVPAFSVNIEEDPQDMADMIEYLNGSETSKWGAVRAKNGHPKPYNVKYIGIGNEEVIRHESNEAYDYYIKKFTQFHDAMKAKDPNLSLIVAVEWRPNLVTDMERVFHTVNGKADYWDYHPWADPLITGKVVDEKLTQMKELFYKWDPDTKMKCVIFEENGDTHNMRRVLGHVTLQNSVRRHGEFVLASCAANALQPYRQNDNSWNQGQVFFTPTQVWGMPPFYAQQMASNNHQPLLVESQTKGELDVTATRDEASKTLVLHIANIQPNSIKADIDISSFGNAKNVKIITLSGKLNGVNTPEEPRKIAPQEKKLDNKTKFEYDFPENSYSILVVTK